MVIIVMFSAMWIVFHIGTRYYVKSRIQNELDSQIEKLQTGVYAIEFRETEYANTDIFDEAEYADTDMSLYVIIKGKEISGTNVNGGHNNAYYCTNSFADDSLVPVNLIAVSTESQYFPESDDRNTNIINYYKENPDIAGEENYRHIKINKRDYYIMVRDGMGEDKNMAYIVTATPTELYEFVGKINFIFIIIMIVLGIVLLLLSYRAGIRLERSKEKLKDYFQNASHELKTPIMLIQGYAEGISTDVIKNHSKAAEIILCESERMNSLVQEILLLSEMDSGYANMSRQKLNITEIIYDCMNVLEAEAGKKKIKFVVDISADEEYLILGNEAQLEKAFMNILVNALRYARHQIKVQIRRSKKWIKTDIIDDGQGISATDMPHIFERFYKGENGGQYGIGLAIVKEIVILHKGKIKVVNHNGAAFSVWLRAREDK